MSCPDCTKGTILPGEPTGSITASGAYFTNSPGATNKRAIILLTDIFGLPLKNSKILADNFAKRLNCDVWVPDVFDGRPPIGVDQLSVPQRAGDKIGFFGWIKFIFAVIPSLPAMIRSRPSVVDGRVNSFITKLQEERKYEQLGAVGYCFGGSIAIRFGSTDLFQSLVICHPGRTTIDEIRSVKVPAAWACAEEDMTFKPALRAEAEAIFAERKGKDNFIDYEFKDYKGTVHGFAARPNLSYPEVKEGHEKAFEQAVDWFNKTLAV